MSILKIAIVALVTIAISGCHPVHPHNGDFCPPGQAKKGNC